MHVQHCSTFSIANLPIHLQLPYDLWLRKLWHEQWTCNATVSPTHWIVWMILSWSCLDLNKGMSWSHFGTKKGFDIKSYQLYWKHWKSNSLQTICNCYHAQLEWNAECVLHKAQMNFGVPKCGRIHNPQKLVFIKISSDIKVIINFCLASFSLTIAFLKKVFYS
jgi:hypothetical protein